MECRNERGGLGLSPRWGPCRHAGSVSSRPFAVIRVGILQWLAPLTFLQMGRGLAPVTLYQEEKEKLRRLYCDQREQPPECVRNHLGVPTRLAINHLHQSKSFLSSRKLQGEIKNGNAQEQRL